MLGLGETDEQVHAVLKCKSDFCVLVDPISKQVGGGAAQQNSVLEHVIQVAVWQVVGSQFLKPLLPKPKFKLLPGSF